MKRLQDFRIPNRNPVIHLKVPGVVVVWTHFEVNFFSHSRKLTWNPKNVTKRVENETHLHLHTRLEASKRRFVFVAIQISINPKFKIYHYILCSPAGQGEDAFIGKSLHNSHLSSRVVGSPAWDASLDLRSAKSHATLPPKILGLAVVFFVTKNKHGKQQGFPESPHRKVVSFIFFLLQKTRQSSA